MKTHFFIKKHKKILELVPNQYKLIERLSRRQMQRKSIHSSLNINAKREPNENDANTRRQNNKLHIGVHSTTTTYWWKFIAQFFVHFYLFLYNDKKYLLSIGNWHSRQFLFGHLRNELLILIQRFIRILF